MRTGRVFLTVLLISGFFLATGVASADTVATFADPSPNGATPLFGLNGSGFSGGWTGTGLDLITPISGGNYPNATFTMSNLTVLDPSTGQLSGGTILFDDNGGNLILRIDFDGARLYDPFGFGATTLVGETVAFSGPIITSPLSQQSFAFSFANQQTTPGGYTWTAAFTSSAVIPEPGTLALLALGAVGTWIRRR